MNHTEQSRMPNRKGHLISWLLNRSQASSTKRMHQAIGQRLPLVHVGTLVFIARRIIHTQWLLRFLICNCNSTGTSIDRWPSRDIPTTISLPGSKPGVWSCTSPARISAELLYPKHQGIGQFSVLYSISRYLFCSWITEITWLDDSKHIQIWWILLPTEYLRRASTTPIVRIHIYLQSISSVVFRRWCCWSTNRGQ